MRYLAVITLLVLALAMVQPVAAQSFKPDFGASFKAYVKDDYATALRHFKPLAEQGNAGAQYWLGRMYRYGYGVTPNNKKAVRWYRLSANQGDASGQFALGSMYRDGHGVLQDLVMSYVWMNVSVANSANAWTEQQRGKVLTRLNASERKLARKLSKRCFKKPTKCPEYSY